jgi:hypothetical protein
LGDEVDVVVRSDGSLSGGGTYRWTFGDPEAPTALEMPTQPSEFPTPLHLLLGGAGLAVLLGLVFLLAGASRAHRPVRSRRSRRRPADTTRATSGWAPPGATADPDVWSGDGPTSLPPFQDPDGPRPPT